jgi:cytochrome c-type biogenesis protein CcmH
MSLLYAIGLAAVILLAMVVLFRLPRAAGFAVGSALILGLAGFLLQSDPAKPAAPARTAETGKQVDGSPLVEARRLFFAANVAPQYHVILADGFTRQGQYAEAATILRNATAKYPGDGEAWVALGNALVAHGQGTLSPPALMAYRKAALTAPDSLAPGFFMGVAELQAGRLVEGYKLWASALRQSPADAPGRAELEQRLGQLDVLMRRIAVQQ